MLIKCPECGVFGKIFYLFNILMLLWVITSMNAASDVTTKAVSEAEKAGAAIGTGIGMTFLMVIWAIGDIITGMLALMTRPKGS